MDRTYFQVFEGRSSPNQKHIAGSLEEDFGQYSPAILIQNDGSIIIVALKAISYIFLATLDVITCLTLSELTHIAFRRTLLSAPQTTSHLKCSCKRATRKNVTGGRSGAFCTRCWSGTRHSAPNTPRRPIARSWTGARRSHSPTTWSCRLTPRTWLNGTQVMQSGALTGGSIFTRKIARFLPYLAFPLMADYMLASNSYLSFV